MKLKGERDFKAEDLYNLLSNEVMQSFASYVGFIKGASLDDMSSMDDLVAIVEEEQPVRYSVFIGLLNADFDLETLKVLIDIERKHGNLIETIANKLTAVKDKVNIFNEYEVRGFIMNSVYLLKSYYVLEETSGNGSENTL